MYGTIIAPMILIAVVSSVLIGTIAAQESTNFTTTTVPSITSEATQTIELSPTTRIKPWPFSNGTFPPIVEANTLTRIAITDAGELSRTLSEGDGAATGKVHVRRMTLTPGAAVVKFRVESVGDASTITVSSSNADGIVTIHSDAVKTGNPPAEYGTVQTLFVSMAVVVAGGVLLWARRKYNEKQLKVEREW